MSENKVLATVNGKEITEKDVEALLRGLGPQQAMQFNSEEGKKRLLTELVNQELFYQNALDNKFEEEEAFKVEVENMKVNLLKQYAIRKVLNDISVAPEEVEKYYNDNKEQFKNPESVKASHILVDEEDKAKEILKEINDGLSFEEGAKKYSKCPSNAKGGDLGSFTRGKMVPEFEEAAFKMEKGEVSEPVKTQFGYHIIKVTDKQPESMKTFDEVKNQLSQQLVAQKQNEAYFNKSNELKQKYEVEIAE
ncbi:peptidylprolyl isomerase [Dethiothermospora halolimnae]|uniref:peptidylprolyl isomerase n=1 Tax=Dethiothermospora halolimnae TaxID=3114390 RepID=UPI003CCBCB0E